METMKQIRVANLVNECSNIMRDIYNELVQLREAFIKGEIKACKARREYFRLIKRANMYNKISYRISEKYTVTAEFNISNFSELITFFECW